MSAPTVFWFTPLTDDAMTAVAYAGVGCSALLMLGFHSSVLCFILWLLYFSIVTVADGTRYIRVHCVLRA